MPSKPRVLVSLVAAVAAVASIAFVNAVPAYAKSTIICNSDRSGDGPKENRNTFRIPSGDFTTVTIDLCVSREDKNSQRGAIARQIDWGGPYPTGRRFNYFKLTVRLERADKVIKTKTCDLTAAINHYRYPLHVYRCGPLWYSHAHKYKWTADATVHYDIYGDGKGDMVWALRGSPEVY